VNPTPLREGLFWFGTFVFSDGGRVIYFPGLRDHQLWTFAAGANGTIRQERFEVDHCSLDSSRATWHVTEQGSRRHIGTFRTEALGEGRVLWFGMAIASPDVLRPALKETLAKAAVPLNDAERRIAVALQAREGVVFNTLLVDQDHAPTAPGFMHFSVIVGPVGFAPYRGTQLAFPFGSPYINPPLANLTGIFLRSHRLSLPPYFDIEVVATTLPGAVTVPATFTSP